MTRNPSFNDIAIAAEFKDAKFLRKFGDMFNDPNSGW